MAHLLSELTISQFRQLQNITIHFDTSIKAIIGSNNSGKTSILMAIKLVYLILQTWSTKEEDQFQINSLQHYSTTLLGLPFEHLFPFSDEILFTAILGNKSCSRVSVVLNTLKQCFVRCNSTELAHLYIKQFAVGYLYPVFMPTFEEPQIELQFYPIPWYDTKLFTSKIRNVFKLLIPEKRQEILSDLCFFFEDVIDMMLEQDAVTNFLHLRVKRIHEKGVMDSSHLLDIASFGTGELQILYLILMFHYQTHVQQKPFLFYILDEPTSFLNEKWIVKLYQFMNSKQQCQFIVATHSNELITQLPNANIFSCEYISDTNKEEGQNTPHNGDDEQQTKLQKENTLLKKQIAYLLQVLEKECDGKVVKQTQHILHQIKEDYEVT